MKNLVRMQPVSLCRQGWSLVRLPAPMISFNGIHAVTMSFAILLGIQGFSQSTQPRWQANPNTEGVSVSDPDLADLQEQKSSHLLFMENRGQVRDEKGNASPEILFAGRSAGCKVFLRADGLSYQFEKTECISGCDSSDKSMDLVNRLATKEETKVSTHRMDMKLLGADINPRVVREKENAYYENYYNVPAFPSGLSGVKSFERIKLEDIYHNIDWIVYSTEKGIKYDFVIRPGGDPSQIRMEYSWAEDISLNADGSLTFRHPSVRSPKRPRFVIKMAGM